MCQFELMVSGPVLGITEKNLALFSRQWLRMAHAAGSRGNYPWGNG